MAGSAGASTDAGGGWDATDWLAFFDERAAIAEIDGGLSRAEADRRAFDAAIVQWMNSVPPEETNPAGCALCGEPRGRAGDDAVAVLGVAGGEPLWLHHACHAEWMARRRRQAVEALTALGLRAPGTEDR